MTIDPLVEALRGAAAPSGPPSARLATVTAFGGSGVTVRFDGESVASSRPYRTTASVRVGQRVLMIRVGQSYVCTGAVATQAGPAHPLSNFGSFQATATNLPNNAGLYTTHHFSGGFAVPGNATYAHVNFAVAAHNTANAATTWYPTMRKANSGGGTVADLSLGPLTSHNQGNPALNLGFVASGFLDVRDIPGGTVQPYVNAVNDAGSGAWTHVGYLQVVVTFFGYV